jgi:outer membrane protein assembly factor BamD
MRKGLSVLLVCAMILAGGCASKYGRVLKSKDNEYKLKMAEQYYSKQEYLKAQQIFAEIMPVFKGDIRFEDIYYKYAYTAYYLRDYINSENLFKSYTENFPNSTRAEECEYMRCMSFYRQSAKVDLDQTSTVKAIALMQAFINTHPESSRVKDATGIIDECRAKLELKEYKSARLYYDIGYFKAAATAFGVLCDNYPDSDKGDLYKMEEIQSYFKLASQSVKEKQETRFETVIAECTDFELRFNESEYLEKIKELKTLSQNFINNIKNEQTAQTTSR